MIAREMKSYQLTRPAITLDGYGASVFTYSTLRTIDVAIYFDSQISLNNPQYAEATHTGLTKDKNIQMKDKIGNYEVLQVNPIGRLNQLILKEV